MKLIAPISAVRRPICRRRLCSTTTSCEGAARLLRTAMPQREVLKISLSRTAMNDADVMKTPAAALNNSPMPSIELASTLQLVAWVLSLPTNITPDCPMERKRERLTVTCVERLAISTPPPPRARNVPTYNIILYYIISRQQSIQREINQSINQSINAC